MKKRLATLLDLVHGEARYGDKPYSYHLDAVERILIEAGMDTEEDRETARCHDAIEDARAEQRDEVMEILKEELTEHSFSCVWAMSGFGANRKARNADAYAKIAAYPAAANYKVADRIANMESSKKWQPHLFAMYSKEAPAFIDNVVSHATNEKLVERFHAIIQ